MGKYLETSLLLKTTGVCSAIIIISSLLFSCTDSGNESLSTDHIDDLGVTDSVHQTIEARHTKHGFDVFNPMMDSLKQCVKNKRIPEFLFDNRLDFDYSLLSDHSNRSFRHELIEGIEDVDYINLVLKSDRVAELKKLPVYDVNNRMDVFVYDNTAYIKKSMFDLLIERRNVLMAK